VPRDRFVGNVEFHAMISRFAFPRRFQRRTSEPIRSEAARGASTPRCSAGKMATIVNLCVPAELVIQNRLRSRELYLPTPNANFFTERAQTARIRSPSRRSSNEDRFY